VGQVKPDLKKTLTRFEEFGGNIEGDISASNACFNFPPRLATVFLDIEQTLLIMRQGDAVLIR